MMIRMYMMNMPSEEPGPPQLGAALRTIHADRAWWQKILVGGAIWLTIAGWLVVEGYQLESVDNTRQGYPTPLPRWNLIGDKLVIGLFALVIDFFYFFFPVLCGGVVLFCGTLAAGLSGSAETARIVASTTLGLIGLFLLGMWLTGVSPISKQRYADDGELGSVLSGGLAFELLRAPVRATYFRARVLSAPMYLLALAVLALSVRLLGESLIIGLVVGWLGLSVLLYARLVTIQLYSKATRSIELQRFATPRQGSER